MLTDPLNFVFVYVGDFARSLKFARSFIYIGMYMYMHACTYLESVGNFDLTNC